MTTLMTVSNQSEVATSDTVGVANNQSEFHSTDE